MLYADGETTTRRGAVTAQDQRTLRQGQGSSPPACLRPPLPSTTLPRCVPARQPLGPPPRGPGASRAAGISLPNRSSGSAEDSEPSAGTPRAGGTGDRHCPGRGLQRAPCRAGMRATQVTAAETGPGSRSRAARGRLPRPRLANRRLPRQVPGLSGLGFPRRAGGKAARPQGPGRTFPGHSAAPFRRCSS